MSSEVAAGEVRRHLPDLLRRVAEGERFVITKRGVAVAQLVPVEASGCQDLAAVVDELKTMRRGRRVTGSEVRQMIEEGRRY